MPVVCINRPNRTHPRPFTVRDLARLYCRLASEGMTDLEFKAEVLARCGRDVCEVERGDWRERVQDALDAIEAVLEWLLKALEVGPSAGKLLVHLWRLLPAPIKAWIERIFGRVINEIRKRIDDIRKRLPPP